MLPRHPKPLFPSLCGSPFCFVLPLLIPLNAGKKGSHSQISSLHNHEKRHKSTNTCDARSPHWGLPSSGLTGMAFTFSLHSGHFYSFISQWKERRGSLGRALSLWIEERQGRAGALIPPFLMPVHVLMQSIMYLLPHWWGAQCLHEQGVAIFASHNNFFITCLFQ